MKYGICHYLFSQISISSIYEALTERSAPWLTEGASGGGSASCLTLKDHRQWKRQELGLLREELHPLHPTLHWNDAARSLTERANVLSRKRVFPSSREKSVVPTKATRWQENPSLQIFLGSLHVPLQLHHLIPFWVSLFVEQTLIIHCDRMYASHGYTKISNQPPLSWVWGRDHCPSIPNLPICLSNRGTCVGAGGNSLKSHLTLWLKVMFLDEMLRAH